MERTWSDQPEELEEAEVVGTMHAHDVIVEVRRALSDCELRWYVTFGTMFMSRTYRCSNVETVLLLLLNPKKPPEGAKRMVARP